MISQIRGFTSFMQELSCQQREVLSSMCGIGQSHVQVVHQVESSQMIIEDLSETRDRLAKETASIPIVKTEVKKLLHTDKNSSKKK
jgi:hypothetical protein